ncbi:MAG: RnfABCDGE type electron transport complex subunit G [Clostridia bacterium]|nr:RnfABCDGE type electron transport complex subunit G [Clostridia bacterium]
MKNTKFKAIAIPAVTLTLICIIVAGLLGTVNAVTVDKIAQLEAEKLAESQMLVLPDAQSFEEVQEGAYCGKDASGQTVGYVMVTSRQGYGGEVKTVVGIDNEGVITGVTVTADDETPGLGARSTGENFRSQFNGITINDIVGVSKDKNGGTIDALSGATITSRAVCGAVSDAIELYKTVKGA